jgi:hypothetical protein
MKTLRKVLLVAGGLAIIGAVAFVLLGGVRRSKTDLLNRWIKELDSSDFTLMRNAQKQIVQSGRGVLPVLSGEFVLSHRRQQRALIAYLIGEIDSEDYNRFLIAHARKGDICDLARYLNSKALKRLSKDEIDGLRIQYIKLQARGDLNMEENRCVESFLQRIKPEGK